MKQQTALTEQLQNKFDELPVHGEPAADWQKLQKALNLAMPVGILSFFLNGKVWMVKKMLWLYLLGLGVGGCAALVIYYPQTPNTNIARTIAGDTVIARKDTFISKHKALPQKTPKDTAVRKRKTLRPKVPKDTIVRQQKTFASKSIKDTIIRKRKASPPAMSKDTTIRKHKTPPAYALKLPRPYAPIDTAVRQHKTWPPKPVRDTTHRKYKKAPPLLTD